jgi:hypothetical protein
LSDIKRWSQTTNDLKKFKIFQKEVSAKLMKDSSLENRLK